MTGDQLRTKNVTVAKDSSSHRAVRMVKRRHFIVNPYQTKLDTTLGE